jgi:hypothetical protein
MRETRRNAGTLAWVFAVLAVTGTTAASFGADGKAYDVARLIVSVLFTVFLLVAIAEWLRRRRDLQPSVRTRRPRA